MYKEITVHKYMHIPYKVSPNLPFAHGYKTYVCMLINRNSVESFHAQREVKLKVYDFQTTKSSPYLSTLRTTIRGQLAIYLASFNIAYLNYLSTF